jgi:hypothetical protein
MTLKIDVIKDKISLKTTLSCVTSPMILHVTTVK